MFLIKNYKIIIWDFDGVIKDSIIAKGYAFEKLFKRYGEKISQRVKTHHYENEGLSRYNKIPLYFSWTKKNILKNTIRDLLNEFSSIVSRNVIDSPWVPGV